MKGRHFLATLVFTGWIMGCGTGKTPTVDRATFDRHMQGRDFRIQIRTVEPLATQAMNQVGMSGLLLPGNTINRIDVGGQGYFLAVKGDSVQMNAPYYGERQMGGSYNPTETGMRFHEVAQDMDISQSRDGNWYEMRFSVRAEDGEALDVVARIFPNLRSTLGINSAERNFIRYEGDMERPEPAAKP
ncbi:DUF4251 domain-containing protein [Maribacter sp. 2307ULW6-5]|uniref:DUF4251 domain-containing protein n=1 Tax=Maribacter sp. 2307ULW6-5 TaxID=3386275 RepID=UPI0039BD820C